MQRGPRTRTDDERAAILADQIERYQWEGWRVLTSTATTATLTRPKRLSMVAAVFWLLFLVVGLLVYLLVYAARRDPVVRLSVDANGLVYAEFSGCGYEAPRLQGDWQCRHCLYPNARQHAACVRCHQPRSS